MSDEKEKPVHPARSSESERDVQSHPETTFLPPLKMVLAFIDPDKKKKDTTEQASSDEKNVEKLIEKLSEEDE
jgi:hypothetical protein